MITEEQFKQQPVPRQLGALAANLARAASCSRWPEPNAVVPPMLMESIFFIEWIAPQLSPDTAGELVDLQLMLSLWRTSWSQAQPAHSQRTLLSFQAQKWANRILDYSGLRAPR